MSLIDTIKYHYRIFFGTEISANLLNEYIIKLENGTLKYNDIILNFYNSPNFQPIFEQVYRLHKAALMREPDYYALLQIIHKIQKGELTIEKLAEQFVNSDEFKKHYGDPRDYENFAEKLCVNILERPADRDGVVDFAKKLERGEITTAQAVRIFAESEENIRQDAPLMYAYWTTAFINNEDPERTNNQQVRQQFEDMKKLFSSFLNRYSLQKLLQISIMDNIERFNADNPILTIQSRYFIDTLSDSDAKTLLSTLDSTRESIDINVLKIVRTIPEDDSTGNSPDVQISIIFDENIQRGKGFIYIHNLITDELVEKIDINNTNNVFVRDKYIIFIPQKKFNTNASYYIKMDSTAIVSTSGKVFYGINDRETFNFTVSASTTDTGIGGGTEKNDTVDGTSKNDVINGYLGNDLIKGGAGDDTLLGGRGNDTIYGGTGNDVIDGGEDDDEICGDEGDDLIFGGSGNDKIFVSSGNDTIDGGDGVDTLLGSQGNDLIYLLNIENIEYIDASGGDDTVKGTSGNDTFYLANFKNVEYLFGSDGNDKFYLDIHDTSKVNFIDGGSGVDTLFGTYGNDIIKLDARPNNIINMEVIDAGPGDDIIEGSPVGETIIGGHGADTLAGWGGADVYYFRKNDSNYYDHRIDTIRHFITGEDKIAFEGGSTPSTTRDTTSGWITVERDKNGDGKITEDEKEYRYTIISNGAYAEVQIDSGATPYDDLADAFTLAASIMQGGFAGGTGKGSHYVLVGVDKNPQIGSFQPEFYLFWDYNNNGVPDMAIKIEGILWLYQFDATDILGGLSF